MLAEAIKQAIFILESPTVYPLAKGAGSVERLRKAKARALIWLMRGARTIPCRPIWWRHLIGVYKIPVR